MWVTMWALEDIVTIRNLFWHFPGKKNIVILFVLLLIILLIVYIMIRHLNVSLKVVN